MAAPAGRFDEPVKKPLLWSAELPHLYTVVVTLKSPEGKGIEATATRLGFRSVKVKDRMLLINSRRVLIKGVNRHDHHDTKGKALDRETMRLDAVTMKRFNFNSVRASHYPNDPYWLDLCDVILNFDWLEGTNPITASAKTHGSDYLATRLLPAMQEILPQVVRRQIVLNPPKETMKIRLVVSLVGLAISFALPTFAQKDTVDPKIAQQIRVLAAKYDEAINRQDAAAVAALYTQDGVWMTHDGTFHGREAIEKGYVQLDVKSWQIGNYITTVDRVIAVGNEVRSTGRWSCVHKNWSGATGNADGHYSWVIVREGDTWKIRRNTASGSGGIL